MKKNYYRMPKLCRNYNKILVLVMLKLCRNLQIVSAVSAFRQVSAFWRFGSFCTNKRVSAFSTRPNEFWQATLGVTHITSYLFYYKLYPLPPCQI